MEDKEKCVHGGCDCGCGNSGCGCGDDEGEFITLEFDDGVEVECEILGVFDSEGKEYIALLPDDGTDDVYIYGYKENGEDEFDLIDIDDDKEFERVVKVFEALTAEEPEE